MAATLLCVAALTAVPATPTFADQVRHDQWHLNVLDVARAHKHSQGQGVTVAVIDTGVDPHPNLRRNLLRGWDVVPGGSGDGRQDADGHGTGMAGLIAAHGRNDTDGALGIAPKAKIVPIRYSSSEDNGGSLEIGAAVRQALGSGAKVINISAATGPSTELQQMISAAVAADIVVVTGSGNHPKNAAIGYPARYEGVVVAAATHQSGNHAGVSLSGPEVDIAAPGVGIVSTSRAGGYRKGTGTSPSAALVSGAVALLRSKYPELSAKDVIHRLTSTATDKGAPGRDNQYGHGMLNLVAALTADVPQLKAGVTASPTAATSTWSPTPAAETSTRPPMAGTGSEARMGSATVFGVIAAVIVGGAVALIAIMIGRRRGRSRAVS